MSYRSVVVDLFRSIGDWFLVYSKDGPVRLRLALAADMAQHHTLPRVLIQTLTRLSTAARILTTHICLLCCMQPLFQTFYFGAHRLLSISVTDPRPAS